jgi:hypothetical protein
MFVSARQVVDALKHRYSGDDSSAPNVDSGEMAAFIQDLSPDSLPDDHAFLSVIAEQKSEWIPSADDRAVLQSIRDCLNMIYNLLDLEPEITRRLHATNALIAARMLAAPGFPLEETEHSILTVLDEVVGAAIGWSADQGRAAEKVLDEIDAVIAGLKEEAADFEKIETGFRVFIEKEQSRITKLEDRLTASESGLIRSRRGRAMAAEMINKFMEGRLLTAGIAAFLKGPWYESMQLLAITEGVDGENWIRAAKLTETLVWTYQPLKAEKPDDKQRLYRIIEHLPSEIHDLLLVLEHQGDSAEAALAEIESDHIAVISGQELEYAAFDLIKTEEDESRGKPAVSRILLRKVTALEPGQWIIYETEDKRARVKLLLKLADVRQMLFTNRNGMKALDITFDELAYLMSSGVIKPLNHFDIFSTTFSAFYQGLIEAHQRKMVEDEAAQHRAEEAETARQKALEEAEDAEKARHAEEQRRQEEEKQDRLGRAMTEAAKPENQQQVAEVTEIVERLNTGAWLKLPGPDSGLIEGKLAVRVGKKLIFVSGTGTKMGDYTVEQLVTLLVTGEAEIADAGVEFEDTLAQVVSKLRVDRTKSYDDLTGSE